MPEKQVPVALSGEEIRDAVAFYVREELKRSCHCNDSAAYSSFSVEIHIRMKLNDYGRHVQDNHIVYVSEGEVSPETVATEVDVFVPEKPPNQVRVETEQLVPVTTQVDGKTVVKKVKYQPRKK